MAKEPQQQDAATQAPAKTSKRKKEFKKKREKRIVPHGVAHIQAGGGIVADSTPIGEYDVSVNKSKALLRALEAAHGKK